MQTERELYMGIRIYEEITIFQAWKFSGKDRFVNASFPSLIKDGNDNSFPLIHLHSSNAFFEDFTGKNFYTFFD